MTSVNNSNNANDRDSDFPNNAVGNIGRLRRFLLASAAFPFLTHEADLPPPAQQLISSRARIILNFCREYLAHRNATTGWDIDLYASGGYVRDLLLGRISPDLDLSLGLSRCPPGVTVADVAEGMDGFCRLRPDLAVKSVEVKSGKSGRAERKAVDAERICLVLGSGEGVELDLLPTIGAEIYDSGDRIPRRDGRGSAEQDSLRRDLTIGSMLLRVTRTEGDNSKPSAWTGLGKRGEDALAVAAVRAASDLRFVLLDYHGGIEDIATRTLRCPVPRNASFAEIWEQAVRSSDDEDLARSLGMHPDRDMDNSNVYWDEGTKIQALWWAKMMRDDPYRLLRTLRFSATLGFRVDSTFWTAAVPFALQPGVFDKVSHTRKVDELRKVAKGVGVPGLVRFLGTVLNPPIGGSALRDAFFGVSLANIGVVDGSRAQRLAAQLSLDLSVDARVGVALVVAFLTCECGDDRDAACDEGTEKDASTAIAARLIRTQRLVETACDGLRAPASIRRGAVDLLSISRRLLEPLPVSGMYTLFARAVSWPTPSVPVSMEDRARQFATMVRLWEVLRLDPSRRRESLPDPRSVMALLIAAAEDIAPPEAAEMLRGMVADLLLLSSLREAGPQPREGALGGAVAGLPEVPLHLRGRMMAAVHVLTRLRRDAPTIETPDQLRTYLQIDCEGLLTELTDEWWEEEKEGDGKASKNGAWVDSELRPSYIKK